MDKTTLWELYLRFTDQDYAKKNKGQFVITAKSLEAALSPSMSTNGKHKHKPTGDACTEEELKQAFVECGKDYHGGYIDFQDFFKLITANARGECDK